MERLIRPTKRCRNLAILYLIFFVSVGLASACGMWFSALPERRFLAAVFMAVFWGFWSLLSCWLLLAYWRKELRIVNGQITQRGVIGLKEIDLRSLTSVRWGIAPRSSGGFILRTATEKVTILLSNFDPEDRLWLIRYFRNGVSEGLQEGWALFCHKIAVPLRDKSTPPHAVPKPGTVRITRSRWDWYFVPSIVLSIILGVVFCWWLEQPQMLVFPAAAGRAVALYSIHDTTGRARYRTDYITSKTGQLSRLLGVLVWCCSSGRCPVGNIGCAHACRFNHRGHCPGPVVWHPPVAIQSTGPSTAKARGRRCRQLSLEVGRRRSSSKGIQR